MAVSDNRLLSNIFTKLNHWLEKQPCVSRVAFKWELLIESFENRSFLSNFFWCSVKWVELEVILFLPEESSGIETAYPHRSSVCPYLEWCHKFTYFACKAIQVSPERQLNWLACIFPGGKNFFLILFSQLGLGKVYCPAKRLYLCQGKKRYGGKSTCLPTQIQNKAFSNVDLATSLEGLFSSCFS